MSDYKGLLLFKAKGSLVPEAFLEEIAKKFPSAMGFAIAAKNPQTRQPELELAHVVEPNSAKNIGECFSIAKDNDVLAYFADFPENFTAESVQPFVVLKNSQGAPILVAALSGDVNPVFAKGSNLGHSHDYFANEKLLVPRFAKMFTEKGNDLSKVMAHLNEPETQETLINSLTTDNMTLAIMALNGTIHVLDNNSERHMKYPWGWVSDHLDYKEVVAQIEPENVPLSLAQRMKAAATTSETRKKIAGRISSTSNVPKIAEVTPVVSKTEEPPKAEEQRTRPKWDGFIQGDMAQPVPAPEDIKNPDEYEWISPPKSLSTNKMLKSWYQLRIGTYPQGYKQFPAVPVKKTRLAELQQSSQTVRKDTAAHNIPATPAPALANVTEVIPIVPGSEKKEFASKILPKVLENKFETLESIEEIAAAEERYPSFAKQNGLDDLTVMLNTSFTTYVEMCTTTPTEAARLLLDYAYRIKKLMAAAAKPVVTQKEDGGVTIEAPKRKIAGRKIA
jgi:hypothetical protein